MKRNTKTQTPTLTSDKIKQNLGTKIKYQNTKFNICLNSFIQIINKINVVHQWNDVDDDIND